MTEGQPATQARNIPILKDNELRLAKMRRQLEEIFRSLDLVHDEISVCSEAARSEGQPEIANVLSLSVCNRLFGQLKSLTSVIERLAVVPAYPRTKIWKKQRRRWKLRHDDEESAPQGSCSSPIAHSGARS